MSSPTSTWQDRRGMFQKGKEKHEPSSPDTRRFSETGSITNAIRRSSTASSEEKSSFPTASAGQRRRSSAASNGLFGNLTTMKRGSQDYGTKRASQTEMLNNNGGMVSGWFNSTFKGIQKQPDMQEQSKDSKRGVME